MKAWQGSYGVSDYDGIVSPAYYVFDLDCDYEVFFHRAIRSRYYINEFERYSIGIRIGQWDFPIDKLKEMIFLTPPFPEQQKIVAELDKKCGAIDRLVQKLNSEIGLFSEYKTRLISDVVTGKLDVQDVKIPEYVKTDEPIEDTEETEND
jgi:type I restriction enzyme S subunit